ncbi:MAG TPA: ORF6N domain-containing protein [Candidatus Paceibacterota bacterium]
MDQQIPRRLVVPLDHIDQAIFLLRGQKIMLDADLANLYGVTTKRLNEQVKRNRARFPVDFMFQLTKGEADILRSQFATSSERHGGRRTLPFAFTEHGAVMLASVLNTTIAVHASIQVVRAFVRLRRLLATNVNLARKLAELENKYDAKFKVVFEAIRRLMIPPEPKRQPIGFRTRH